MGSELRAALRTPEQAGAYIERLEKRVAALEAGLRYWLPKTEPLIHQFDDPSTAHRQQWHKARALLEAKDE